MYYHLLNNNKYFNMYIIIIHILITTLIKVFTQYRILQKYNFYFNKLFKATLLKYTCLLYVNKKLN